MILLLLPVISDPTMKSLFNPANVNITSASPHKEELSMLIPNRIPSNVVLASSHCSPRRIRCCSEKRVSLPSICQYRSDIDQTSVRRRRVPDIVSTPASIGRYPDHDPTSATLPDTIPRPRVHFSTAKAPRSSSDALLIFGFRDANRYQKSQARAQNGTCEIWWAQHRARPASFKYRTKPGSQIHNIMSEKERLAHYAEKYMF